MLSATGDLAFEKGDEFVVLARGSPNIWKGTHKGKVGRFLARCVDVIEELDTPTAASAITATVPPAAAAAAAAAAPAATVLRCHVLQTRELSLPTASNDHVLLPNMYIFVL